MSYKHYQYLSDHFPERIKKERENKFVEKEKLIPPGIQLEEETPTVLVKTNLLPKQLTRKGKY